MKNVEDLNEAEIDCAVELRAGFSIMTKAAKAEPIIVSMALASVLAEQCQLAGFTQKEAAQFFRDAWGSFAAKSD